MFVWMGFICLVELGRLDSRIEHMNKQMTGQCLHEKGDEGMRILQCDGGCKLRGGRYR